MRTMKFKAGEDPDEIPPSPAPGSESRSESRRNPMISINEQYDGKMETVDLVARWKYLKNNGHDEEETCNCDQDGDDCDGTCEELYQEFWGLAEILDNMAAPIRTEYRCVQHPGDPEYWLPRVVFTDIDTMSQVVADAVDGAIGPGAFAVLQTNTDYLNDTIADEFWEGAVDSATFYTFPQNWVDILHLNPLL